MTKEQTTPAKNIGISEVTDALDNLVRRGFLKKVKHYGEDAYTDSDRTRELLNNGFSRKEIALILDSEFESKEEALR